MQKKNTPKTVTQKKCVVCNEKITDKKVTAKTCSAKCRQKLFRQTYTKKKGKCLFCGNAFEGTKAKIYCNRSCKESYLRIKNKPTSLQRKFNALKLFGVGTANITVPNIELDELIFFCKAVNINPYKYCYVKDIVSAIRQSECFSIIEACVNDIFKTHQAPSTSPSEKTIILNFEEGQTAYTFFETKTKKGLVDVINQYRQFVAN